MLTSKKIKEYARQCGADLVGIGSMDRFEGSPKLWDPRYILPEAKSIIGLGFRIHRGLLRGYEEGTYMGSYPSMGYANINDVYGPIVLRELGSFIEDAGHEAIIFNNSAIRYGFQTGQAVSPDKPCPDVFLHFRISGLICGMGEIGYSHIFLTPEFGPRQRLAFIVTDAELEPDPIFEGGLCDRCKLCVKECPGKAISPTETTEYTIAGKTYTQAVLDEFRCSAAFQASSPEYNPFGTVETDEVMREIIENGVNCYARKTKPGFFSKGVEEEEKQYWDGGTIHDWMAEKIPFVGAGVKNFNHPGAICGARGCIRACMMHLESQGKLKNKFELPFRIRKPWKLPPRTKDAQQHHFPGGIKMKFSIGYQLPSDSYSIYEAVEEFRERIAEVYYALPHAPSGRSPTGVEENLSPDKTWEIMSEELGEVAKMGVKGVLLLNGACYGSKAISRGFANEICDNIDRLQKLGIISSITTTSPFIARTIKTVFPELKIRASINMRIGTVHGMQYLAELFDGYYMQREYNRNMQHISTLKSWCDENGKTLHFLVNSGCLAFCSAQTFHDNMVSHENDIKQQDNVPMQYPSMCWEFLSDSSNWPTLLQGSWIRPEDLHHYEPFFSVAKLATRMHSRIRTVLNAYIKGSYSGNLLDLLEPGYGPILNGHIIDNKKFPKEWFKSTTTCSRECHTCTYCQNVLKKILS